jgi:hypothetical protein
MAAITIGLVGGSATAAQVYGAIFFNDFPVPIGYPEKSGDFQGSSLEYFKARFTHH